EVALHAKLRQAYTDHDRAHQPFAHQIDAFAKDAAQDRKTEQWPRKFGLKCGHEILPLGFWHGRILRNNGQKWMFAFELGSHCFEVFERRKEDEIVARPA